MLQSQQLAQSPISLKPRVRVGCLLSSITWVTWILMTFGFYKHNLLGGGSRVSMPTLVVALKWKNMSTCSFLTT